MKQLKKIKNDNSAIRLHIVGVVRDNEYFRKLLEYTNENDLGNNIKFLGALEYNELRKEYSECSVFVFPSKEESQGIVLLEAMAAGKPVVATRIGGIPYVVKHEETGLLVEYGNPEELGESITILLKHDDLRKKMGYKGIEIAKEYTGKRIAEKIYTIYSNLFFKQFFMI